MVVGDSANGCSSSFQRTVILREWWLIKCSKEFEGKRFGVAGTEISASVETRAMRVFKSSPIIKAFDVFTLQASDGICITLRGFLNKERVVKSGFMPEICLDFIFGFPPCWEQICNNCFEGMPFGTENNTVHSLINEACCPILSPCKSTKENLGDRPAESRDKSTVNEKNTTEINDKDSPNAASRARDIKTVRKKSLSLQSKSVGKSAEDGRKLELNKVLNNTNDGDHSTEGLNKAKSGDTERDECEDINHENKRKLNESKVKKCNNDEDHGSEGLDKAKCRDVEKYEFEAIDNKVISSADRCATGADNVDKVKSTKATGVSLTSEQRKGELKVTRASSNSLFNDLDKSSKSGKKGKSKKSGNTLKSDDSAVESMDYSETKVKSAKNKRKLDGSKVQNPTTKTSLHSLVKDINANSKSIKRGRPNRSEKTLKSDRNVVEPMNHLGSKADENLSGEKTKRKIDFDFEVTPDKEAKKQMKNVVSPDSLGQKRSRSGRVLVSSLDFWRNQVPVYDLDRNLVQVKEGHKTNSKGKGLDSRKPRR